MRVPPRFLAGDGRSRVDRLSKVLPYSPTGIKWKAGGTGTTKWSIRTNHGGGYSFRLCKRSEELTEECMQRTPLQFATSVHYAD